MGWYQQLKTSSTLTAIEFEGTLKENDGFVYLSIPNSIVTGFLSIICDNNIVHPKDMSHSYVGAHISVMRAEDTDEEIKEIGQKFKFTISGAEKTKSDGWDGVNRVYFITVDSPGLEDLRARYGLSKKHKGHNFHITIAVEKE